MDHERKVYRWSECEAAMQGCLEWCNQLLHSQLRRTRMTTALRLPHVTFRIFSDTGVTPELLEAARLEDEQAEYWCKEFEVHQEESTYDLIRHNFISKAN
jgi:hypothetical protein